MAKGEFIRKSLITNEEYDYFKTVKIKNTKQVAAYIGADVFPVDIRVEKDKEGKRILVFYFIKEDTKEVFSKWCNYEL